MKVAVCLSGQPRFLEECSKSIIENLIKPNNADVFLHVWDYSEQADEPHKFGGDGGWKSHRISKNAHLDAVSLYKPVSYEIEKPFKVKLPAPAHHFSFENFKSANKAEAAEAGVDLQQYASRILSDSYCMWYGIMKSNMLANLHAHKWGFEYDFVVRARFDLNVESQIDLLRFDNRFIYYCDLSQPVGLVSDWLNIGSQRNMSVFSSVCMNYLHAENFYMQNASAFQIQFCNELASSINLQRHGIQTIPFSANVSIPRL